MCHRPINLCSCLEPYSRRFVVVKYSRWMIRSPTSREVFHATISPFPNFLHY